MTSKTFIGILACLSMVNANTYVGFAVDDTASMSQEIASVTSWIRDCVSGTNPSCGTAPTGGWLIVSFNDPSIGRVVGPTVNGQQIVQELESYRVHGGGDCPEMAMTGMEALLNTIPDENDNCKIFLFTDATPRDYIKGPSVIATMKKKRCKYVPVLTGCCGKCKPACDSVSPEYCHDRVTDYVGRSRRSVSTPASSEIDTIFYKMAEETGGHIYVLDKMPPTEMTAFLEKEVTLAFSPEWSVWSDCSVSCGNGTRTRQCLYNREIVSSTRCGLGATIETCNKAVCPTPPPPKGSYSEWVDVTSCSTSCGTLRIKKQTRKCQTKEGKPLPDSECIGESTRVAECVKVSCHGSTPEPDTGYYFTGYGLDAKCKFDSAGMCNKHQTRFCYKKTSTGYDLAEPQSLCSGESENEVSCLFWDCLDW